MTHKALDEDLVIGPTQDRLPAPLRQRITTGQAATTIADGISRRAARTIAPPAWTALALLRGFANIAVDARVAHDRQVHALIHEIEGRAHASPDCLSPDIGS